MQQARQPLAIDLVQQFRQLRVLVIGDALLDSYLEGDAARLSRDGPIPVIRKRHEQRLPGGAANVAANLRALEAEVFLLSIIGADIAGSLLRTALRERGIDDSWLIEEKYINTPHKLRILADGQHVARFDEGSDDTAPRTPENQARLLAHLEALYARCDAVLISDYGYGVLSNDVIECLKTLHCANPKAMLVDAQELARFRTFPATVITPNYQEARRFVEASIGNIPSTDEQPGPDNHTHITFLAQQMLNELATETVTITLAEHGAFLLDRQGHAHHFPAHPIETPHDVGAGDSYASAFILALAAGHKLPEAVQIGIDAAGIAVTKPRTAVVSYQELLQRVSLRVYAAQAQSIEDNNTDDDSSDTQTALARLSALLEVERLAGKSIVFTNGVFDLLHAGHVQFLRQARSLGDMLIVGVNTDTSARRQKGPGRPINNERDRLALVAAMDMVDYAILFDGDTANDLIYALRPQLYVKGGDYTDETVPESEAVRDVGGQLIIVPLVGSIRTTTVINRIKASR